MGHGRKMTSLVLAVGVLKKEIQKEKSFLGGKMVLGGWATAAAMAKEFSQPSRPHPQRAQGQHIP